MAEEDLRSDETKAIDAAIRKAREDERERCAKIADDWLAVFGDRKPEHVSAQTWANDAVRDIAEEIRKPH